MRQIKFRGKRTLNSEWVYGYLVDSNYIRVVTQKHFIDANKVKVKCFETEDFKVDPDTIGQYIGQLDKKNEPIYEGDIMLIKENKSNYPTRHIVVFNTQELSFRLRFEAHWKDKKYTGFYDSKISNINLELFEIIGNIHDNPSLLTNK